MKVAIAQHNPESFRLEAWMAGCRLLSHPMGGYHGRAEQVEPMLLFDHMPLRAKRRCQDRRQYCR